MQRPSMFYGAPPYIFKKARELRNNMTSAEEQLWEYLKKGSWRDTNSEGSILYQNLLLTFTVIH